MKTYYIDYTYKDPWENSVSDRYCAETAEDAESFMKRLQKNREVISLFLTITERII